MGNRGYFTPIRRVVINMAWKIQGPNRNDANQSEEVAYTQSLFICVIVDG